MIPQTRYTKASDGTYLAYQAFGEGDQDLLWVPGFATQGQEFVLYVLTCERWVDGRGG